VIIKEGFRANSTSIGVKAADGHPIMVYSKHIIKIEITDSSSEYRVFNIEFIVTNIKRYNIILG
jgi:hypothetical protein